MNYDVVQNSYMVENALHGSFMVGSLVALDICMQGHTVLVMHD